MVELALPFCRLGFALEFVDDSFLAVEDEEEEEDSNLAISARRAGVRVLTMASRSDRFDRDWTASGMKMEHVIQNCTVWWLEVFPKYQI